MPWWGWIVVGASLLASEVIVDAEFYLVFLGVSALTVGLALAAGVPAPMWLQWLAFAALSAFTFVTFRRKLYGALRGSPPGIQDTLVGEEGIALESIEPGHTGGAELRGSVWRARNGGAIVIAKGARVRVEAASGVVLDVRSAA
jgi:membrane protein implicated in regulation of membrane protease activity